MEALHSLQVLLEGSVLFLSSFVTNICVRNFHFEKAIFLNTTTLLFKCITLLIHAE